MKETFFESFAKFLTAYSEGKLTNPEMDDDKLFKFYIDLVNDETIEMRGRFRCGCDREADYYNMITRLTPISNYAVKQGWHEIADRASALIIDISKILKEEEEKKHVGNDERY